MPASSLDAYAFSEPRVALTHTSAIRIVGWLPDGERLLITRLMPPALSTEHIETFNVQTGALRRYAERHSLYADPVWLDTSQAVAFADIVNKRWLLRISRGEETPAEEVATELASLHLATDREGRQLVFLSPGMGEVQVGALDMSEGRRQVYSFALPLTPPQDLPALGQREGPIPYQSLWHPSGKQIAFYSDTAFYLADLASSQVCQVDLGPHTDGKRWAVHAEWSPNARYLAALTTVGDPVVRFIDLTLIDTSTGEQRHSDLGHQYLSAMAWAPNGRNLLVMAETNQRDVAGAAQSVLYVVDVVTGDSRQMLAEYLFTLSGAYGIAWSPTGRAIALACPTVKQTEGAIAEGRLCIIGVEVKQ